MLHFGYLVIFVIFTWFGDKAASVYWNHINVYCATIMVLLYAYEIFGPVEDADPETLKQIGVR